MPERNLKVVILDLLRSQHLLSAKAIVVALQKLGKKYNKTSIYRAVEQLEENGIVCRHYFTDGEALYEVREDHHVHLVCESCGKVEAATCTYNQPEKVGTFVVSHDHLTLMGKCEECQ